MKSLIFSTAVSYKKPIPGTIYGMILIHSFFVLRLSYFLLASLRILYSSIIKYQSIGSSNKQIIMLFKDIISNMDLTKYTPSFLINSHSKYREYKEDS